MRTIAIAALASAILMSGLTLRSDRNATASVAAQAGMIIDTTAMQSTLDMTSLPEQHTGDLI